MEATISKWHAPEVLDDQIRNADLYFGIARDEGNVVGVITARQQGEAIIVDRLYMRPQTRNLFFSRREDPWVDARGSTRAVSSQSAP